MAILNLSPDSFYAPSHCKNVDQALRQSYKFIKDGAQYLDIGAESSRPGSRPISEEDEIQRLAPVVKKLKKEFPDIKLSIDTYKPEAAKAALDEGAHIINDISGGSLKMLEIISKYKAGVVLMHMKGTPETMQVSPVYDDLLQEISSFLKQKIENAENSGIAKEKIWIDPGIGFGKTVDHNLELIAKLDVFKKLGKPVLLGASRKSFIGEILDQQVGERLEGSLATAIMGYLKGADILRVHDVGATQRTITMFSALWEKTALEEK